MRCDLLRCQAINRDLARFHRLWDLAGQFDVEQAVFQRCTLHLHMVGQLEAAAEGTTGDAAVEEAAFL